MSDTSYLDPFRKPKCPKCGKVDNVISPRIDDPFKVSFSCRACGHHEEIDPDKIPHTSDQETFDMRIREVLRPFLDACKPAPAKPAAEPAGALMVQFTREELIDYCQKFLNKDAVAPRTERYYQDLGLLVDFVTDIWTSKTVFTQPST